MPRYHVEIEETVTVGENIVPPGERPGDTKVIRSFFGMTGRNERYIAKHAFDGWIARTGVSAPRLVDIRLAPPRVS